MSIAHCKIGPAGCAPKLARMCIIGFNDLWRMKPERPRQFTKEFPHSRTSHKSQRILKREGEVRGVQRSVNARGAGLVFWFRPCQPEPASIPGVVELRVLACQFPLAFWISLPTLPGTAGRAGPASATPGHLYNASISAPCGGAVAKVMVSLPSNVNAVVFCPFTLTLSNGVAGIVTRMNVLVTPSPCPWSSTSL